MVKYIVQCYYLESYLLNDKCYVEWYMFGLFYLELQNVIKNVE